MLLRPTSACRNPLGDFGSPGPSVCPSGRQWLRSSRTANAPGDSRRLTDQRRMQAMDPNLVEQTRRSLEVERARILLVLAEEVEHPRRAPTEFVRAQLRATAVFVRPDWGPWLASYAGR